MKQEIVITDNDYNAILTNTIAVIDGARLNIARTVNTSVITAYWEIGGILHERKIESKHGSGVVNRLSEDLQERYPDMGLSPRQLWDMKKFYERFFASEPKLRQAVAVLPWSHIIKLMNKKLNDDQVLYYATQTIQKGWSRDLLVNAIQMQMYESDCKAVSPDNNFQAVLPAEQATYANEVFKSSYNLGFLGVTEPIKEQELERRIVEKVKLFLLEMGKGFTYIGNQHVLEYNGKESRVDLLLYHRKLRCLVAIDLKIGEFKPEYAGKMNYYLSLLDRLERGEDENRSIGIILCAEKDHVEVELALEDMGKPIGVADYRMLIPKEELKQLIQNEIKAFGNN
jgi:predicted nuclease of restriction endonuclease-like (RecB) superfamily